MLVYMIRHGQTDWNAEHRFQGQKDIPINATGRDQATGNGKALADLLGDRARDFDFVSSPMSRTRETMERIRAAMGLEPSAYRMDDRLKEVSFGDWEGHTFPELEKLFPEHLAARATNKWHYIPSGDMAESYEILSWRVGAWLASVDRPTVCVSHGGVIRSVFKLVGNHSHDEACAIGIPQDRILEVRTQSGQVRWL